MTFTRISTAIAAAFVAASASAAPTNVSFTGTTPTYTTSSGASTTGIPATPQNSNEPGWVATQDAWCYTGSCPAGGQGTNYGNSYSFSTNGINVSMKGFGADPAGIVRQSFVGNYGANGYGVTSQNGVAGNSSQPGELIISGSYLLPNTSGPNYEHAIDNANSYDSMLFSFGSAITLNSVSIGFKGDDADATVFVYTGAGDPTASIAGKTYQQLLTSGWTLAGNLFNMSTAGANTFTANGNYSSKYWMVGAYMSAVGTNASSPPAGADSVSDSFKISGLSVSPGSIPEPDSIALVGIAALGLALARRRKAQGA